MKMLLCFITTKPTDCHLRMNAPVAGPVILLQGSRRTMSQATVS